MLLLVLDRRNHRGLSDLSGRVTMPNNGVINEINQRAKLNIGALTTWQSFGGLFNLK